MARQNRSPGKPLPPASRRSVGLMDNRAEILHPREGTTTHVNVAHHGREVERTHPQHWIRPVRRSADVPNTAGPLWSRLDGRHDRRSGRACAPIAGSVIPGAGRPGGVGRGGVGGVTTAGRVIVARCGAAVTGAAKVTGCTGRNGSTNAAIVGIGHPGCCDSDEHGPDHRHRLSGYPGANHTSTIFRRPLRLGRYGRYPNRDSLPDSAA